MIIAPRFLFVLLCCAAPMMVSAQVFRCADGAGKVQFSDRPCAVGQQASEVRIDRRPPAPALPGAAPRLSPEAQRHEQERARRRQQSNDSHQRIDAASAKVRQIRTDNHDPRKCVAARTRMAAMERRDPLLYKISPDYTEFSQAANLHCGN